MIKAVIDRTRLAGAIEISEFGYNVIYIGLVIGFSCYFWRRPEFTFRRADIWAYLLLSIAIGLIAVIVKVLLMVMSVADIVTFDILANTMEKVKTLF